MRLLFLLFLSVCLQSLSLAQCTSSYSDGDANIDGSGLDAWTSVTDYYGQSQCDPAWWGASFYHDYFAYIEIGSPSGRVASIEVPIRQVFRGGGGAYASISLPISSEDGEYYLQVNNRIICTAAGFIFVDSVRRSGFFAVGKARTTYGYDSPLGGCSYHKSCSPASNHWAGDQYTSMGFNRPPNFNSCWNFTSKFHRIVKIGGVRRYWPTADNMGNSYVGHDDWLDCDGPLP